MMKFLSVDVGTTCCKCQLFDEKGEILCYKSEEYGFLSIDRENYINLDTVWQKLKAMILSLEYKDIASICISSLGESFVLLDEADNVLFHPMLYTDARGEEEAKWVEQKVGNERVFNITGVTAHSMYSLYKLLWIKNNHPDLFARAKKAMLVCDYLGYLLTGERVIDYSLAARTGAFDIRKLCFSSELLQEVGIPSNLFSIPKRAGYRVGKVKEELVKSLGLAFAPILVLGSHDQVCASLGAGAIKKGDAVDGMGTVECITTLFDVPSSDIRMGNQGYPCVPYVVGGLYCTYILNYSCGSTVSWFRKKIMHGYCGEEKDYFAYMESKMDENPSGIYVLPYFGGAGTPYQDLGARGAILNLTTQTEDSQVYKAIMEGTAMEMRFNGETVKKYGIKINSLVATGGGSNSDNWLKIKANVQKVEIKTLRSSEGGLCGCAMIQAVAMGTVKNYDEAKKTFVVYDKHYCPAKENSDKYDAYYSKYKKIYKQIRSLN
ncbi:MAG: hypothetical protein E7353_05610 [Clostridiales bacterium]|nr:hypothetical protein [Clostridiales bacterium]